MPSSKECCAARCAHGVSGICLSKYNSFPTELIQMWSRDPAMRRIRRVQPHFAPSQVIRHDPNHIRSQIALRVADSEKWRKAHKEGHEDKTKHGTGDVNLSELETAAPL